MKIETLKISEKLLDEIACAFRARRKAQKMSLRDTALAAGVHDAQVVRVEQGHNVTIASLANLAKGLGCRLVVKLERIPDEEREA